MDPRVVGCIRDMVLLQRAHLSCHRMGIHQMALRGMPYQAQGHRSVLTGEINGAIVQIICHLSQVEDHQEEVDPIVEGGGEAAGLREGVEVDQGL